MHRKLAAALLSAALAVTALSSCGGGSGQMGRYVEETINSGIGVSSQSAVFEDGKLAWIGEQGGRYMRFTQAPEDKSAAAEPLAWLEPLLEGGGGVSGVSESPGGTAYAIYTGEDGQPGLAKSSGGQTAVVIPMENWAAAFARPGGPQGGGPGAAISGPNAAFRFDENSMAPQSVAALDNGFLISYLRQGIVQYDAAGKEVRRYGDSASGMAMGSGGGLAVYGNTLAAPDARAGEILLYDLSTGQQSGKAAYEGLDAATYVGMDARGLFVAGAAGISRWAGGKWELIVDGGLTSLIAPDLTIQSVCAGGGDTWYAFTGGGALDEGGGQLLRFRYDPDMPSQPSETLTVFSLYDNTTARLAISEFQRANPDVRVVMEVGIESPPNAGRGFLRGPQGAAQEETGNSSTVEDVVRALNTRLLAGKGPDLLVLDGLPLQSYIEKGVLKDISALARRLTEEEGLLGNLTGAYAFGGKTYGLPSRFSLPVMVGDGERLDGLGSVAGLVSAVKAYGGQEPALLRAPDSLWQDGGLVMYGYDASVAGFTNADGSLDEAALARYLSDALALTGALRGIYPEANQGGGRTAVFASSGGGPARRMDAGAMDIANGSALIHIQDVENSMGYAMLCSQLGAMEGMAVRPLFGRNYFTPVGGVGVVSSGKRQDLAEAFVRTLVGSAVQDNFMADALPVNRASWGAMAEQLAERFSRAMDTEFNDMGFPALCESLAAPLFVDQYVKNAVSAQAKDLIDGKAAPEEAAAKIVADTRLYLAE
jgi:hypothetical protein